VIVTVVVVVVVVVAVIVVVVLLLLLVVVKGHVVVDDEAKEDVASAVGVAIGSAATMGAAKDHWGTWSVVKLAFGRVLFIADDKGTPIDRVGLGNQELTETEVSPCQHGANGTASNRAGRAD